MNHFRRAFSLYGALIAGFAALAVLLVGVLLSVSRQADDYRVTRQKVEVRHLLDEIFSTLQDAETGQRGYLLTSDRSYLAPYNAALPALANRFDALSGVMGIPQAATGELASLHNLADQKLSELRTTIELKDADKFDEALALVNAGTGKLLMDQIRASITAMLAAQDAELDSRFAFAERAGNWLSLGALLSVLVATTLAGLAIAQAQRQITELTAAHDDLRTANDSLLSEAQQRERLAEQLRQSQKMEAVGQLTGGVAHDFNNMLAIIIGSINVAKRRLARGEADTERFLNSALEGAERAATLTHRLLAFSRQQPLSPVTVDPNKLVSGMAELLHRTLGETVRLETVLAAGLWRTLADPHQLESALVNLSVNARDAMPDGGRLTIETSNAYLDDEYVSRHVGIPAGQYVLLAVTDTGTGMPPDILERAFDPFFTTKPVGKGTGLGLSQVYGFVRQSGGHVKVYSEQGRGTTIKIYLPRFYGAEDVGTVPLLDSNVIPAGRPGEIVLIAEDEDEVRKLAVVSLRELGYTVLHADGAASALKHLDIHPQIDLLFTDIVMPDVGGRKLAEEALRRRPGLKVLYTTGYTRNAVVHNGVLDQGVDLITKPYPFEQLARKVREILDRPTH